MNVLKEKFGEKAYLEELEFDQFDELLVDLDELFPFAFGQIRQRPVFLDVGHEPDFVWRDAVQQLALLIEQPGRRT